MSVGVYVWSMYSVCGIYIVYVYMCGVVCVQRVYVSGVHAVLCICACVVCVLEMCATLFFPVDSGVQRDCLPADFFVPSSLCY